MATSCWCFCTRNGLICTSILFLSIAVIVSLFVSSFDTEEHFDEGGGEESEDAYVLSGTDATVANYSLNEMRNKAVYLEKENATEYPIIVWWTPFTGYSRIVRECSKGSCLFTHSRTEFDNPLTKAFMFYGTQLEWRNLPLPRQRDHMWVLLHEESPKNNWPFMFENAISLFNITSTPSRNSNYPILTQYLISIEMLLRPLKYSTKEKSQNELGLVMYLHSDCDPPSDRDSYVTELMKYIKVDSYGNCLHNKDLPVHLRDPISGMHSEELFDIIAQYKFTLAMENAICNDYITEKFWRPLYAGSVPIVKGSPTVKDWSPNEHSLILIDDYPSPKALADYLLYLDKNDEEYEKYLNFKQTGVTNKRLLKMMEERPWVVEVTSPNDKNMIDSYECFVCDVIHNRTSAENDGTELNSLIANTSHYDCQFPELVLKQEESTSHAIEEMEFWRQVAKRAKYQADAIGPVIKAGKGQKEVTKLFDSAHDNMKIEEWSLTHK